MFNKTWVPVELAVIAIFFIIYASIGADVVLNPDEPRWLIFQRSGAAIILIAIILGWYVINRWVVDKKNRFKKFKDSKAKSFPKWAEEAVTELTNTPAAGAVSSAVIARIVEKLNPVIDDYADVYFGKITKKFVLIETIFIASGTLISGYGDLLPIGWKMLFGT